MAVHQYGDALIEITVLSDREPDGWMAEVWDLTPQTGGELMHYYQPPTGDLSIDLLGNRVPVDLVMWSITLVRDELAGYR